jgi:hypothetical protein
VIKTFKDILFDHSKVSEKILYNVQQDREKKLKPRVLAGVPSNILAFFRKKRSTPTTADIKVTKNALL